MRSQLFLTTIGIITVIALLYNYSMSPTSLTLTDSDHYFIGGGFSGNTTSTTINYMTVFGDGISGTYDNTYITMPHNATLSNLHVTHHGAIPVTFTLHHNGTATGMACTTTGAIQDCSDTTDTVQVVKGDTIALAYTLSSGVDSGHFRYTMEVDPA